MEYTKIITIDSLFRESFTRNISKSTDFRVHLKDNIINVIAMKLHDITIPYSWYTISPDQGNNILILKKTNCSEKYILPAGFYNSYKDICNNLQNESGCSFGSRYCLKQNQYTKKVTICERNTSAGSGCTDECECDSNGSGFQIDVIDCPDKTRTLAWLLGFRKTTCCNYTHTGEGLLLIGEDIRHRYFYLVVNDGKSIDNFNALSMDRKKYINDHILARLIITIQNNNVSSISFEEYNRIYDGPCDINTLDIKLLDEWGYVVNLNEMEMSLSLELTIKL